MYNILLLHTHIKRLVIQEASRGKTIGRTLMNYMVSQVPLKGKILDLGSKSGLASYNRFLQKVDDVDITYTDFYSSSESVVKLDLEQPFPLASDVYDYVFCFNAMEHVYNYRSLLSEAYRVLKTGGILLGSTPFLVRYHADPSDFFRYTHETLERVCVEAGYKNIVVTSLGAGPMTAALMQVQFVFPRWSYGLLIRLALMLDDWILKKRPQLLGRYPESYFFTAVK